MVFYEYESKHAGWVSRLGEFRKHNKSEAHEPIPLAYWSIFLISLGLFFGLVVKDAIYWHHIVVVAIFIIVIAKFHYTWSNTTKITGAYTSIWESVRNSENQGKEEKMHNE